MSTTFIDTLSPDTGILGDGTTNDAGFALSGTSPGSTVSLYLQGTTPVLLGTVTPTGGSWSFDVGDIYGNLADGSYTIRAVNDDNPSDFWEVPVTVDTVAPTVAITGYSAAGGGLVTVAGTTDEAFAAVDVYQNGSLVATVTADANGAWSALHSFAVGDIVAASTADAAGNAASDSDNFVGLANSPPTGSVAVTGTVAEDGVLTASDTLADPDGPGTVSYRWQSSADGGASWTDIAGATGATFEPGDDQVGLILRAVATYTDGANNPEEVASASTGTVANVNDAPTGAVSVSGTPTQGEALTATDTLADSDGMGPVSYRWQSSPDGGQTWADIAGATGASYTPTADDVGLTLRAVASYTDVGGATEEVPGAASAQVLPPPPAIAALSNDTGASTGDGLTNDPAPALSGTAQPGASLVVSWGPHGGGGSAPVGTANVIADPTTGAWSFDFGTAVDADGLPDGDYDFTVADAFTGQVSAAFRVEVDTSAPPLFLSPVAAATNDTTPTFSGFGVPSLFGPLVELRLDGALVATTAVSVAEDWSYTLADPLPEGTYTFEATVRDAAGNARTRAATFTVDLTAPVAPTLGLDPAAPAPAGTGRDTDDTTPTLVGTSAEIGGAVEVRVDGGAWASAGVVALDGTWSYTVPTPLAGGGRLIEARVTDVAGNASSAGSFTLDVNTPAINGLAVLGVAVEDGALTISGPVADLDGMGPILDRWQRSADGGQTWADIAGTEGEISYTPGDADVGALLRYAADFTDGLGAAEFVASAATAAVANVNDLPAGTVTPEGIARRGETLLALDEFEDADGLDGVAVSYRWQREATGDGGGTWADVAGAAGWEYVVGAADVGARLRAVATYTDLQGTAEEVFGTATAVVVPAIIPGSAPGPMPWLSSEVGAMLGDGWAYREAEDATDRYVLADGVVNLGTATGEALAARLYLGLLGRAGDADGMTGAVEAMGEGMGARDLAGIFLGSDEYAARHASPRSDAAFLSDLYEDMLGRAADLEGVFFWGGQMALGATRADLVVALAGSAEAQARFAEDTTGLFVRDAEASLVRAAFKAAFGREGDAGGVAFFAAALEDAPGFGVGALAEILAGSEEFALRHGASGDLGFVDALYRDALGRAADADGMAYFTGLLSGGVVDRADLLAAFATSEEAMARLDWAL